MAGASLNLSAVLHRLFPADSKVRRAFRHRDFRRLWAGAFLSFIGSWIQIMAQQTLVYDLTGSKEKLGLIATCAMLPVTLIGLPAGSVVDRLDKRKLLVLCQSLLAVSAVTIAVLVSAGKIEVWHLILAALFNGTVSCFEMPARQSLVGLIVPKEDIATAIPFMGLTFNLARILGPAIAGWLVATYPLDVCYWVNAGSFGALIVACLSLHVTESAQSRAQGGLQDLVTEGFLYAWREPRLRSIFILEVGVSVFGLFYISQLAALAEDHFKLGRGGNSMLAVAIGVGAISALTVNTITADRHIRGLLLRTAITLLGAGLILLGLIKSAPTGYLLMVLLGFASVTIFNTSNALFQYIAPEQLRGRVLSMHIWALSGVGPLGTYPFGYLAEQTSLSTALIVGGSLTFCLAIYGWSIRHRLEAQDLPEPALGTK